jgi:hypothetical protein
MTVFDIVAAGIVVAFFAFLGYGIVLIFTDQEPDW